MSSPLDLIRIVLVHTSHPGNIGAAARAMKNMGLNRLTLVSPKDFPSGVALGRAASALDVLDAAIVVESLEEAIADCGLVIGTSARSRSIPWPVVEADTCGEKLVAGAAAGNEVALVFGREDRGLSNEELQMCHLHVQIAANQEYPSLNVAAAVMVLCYEIRQGLLALEKRAASGEKLSGNEDISGDIAEASGDIDTFESGKIATGKLTNSGVDKEFNDSLNDMWDQPLASVAEMEGFLAHLEQVLVKLDFHDPENPRQLMPRLRRLYSRIRPDKMEINILRGILTATEQAQGGKNRQ